VSYMVSYWVAWTGKPHTIVEELILPSAADMTGTIGPKNYTDNVFIKQHRFTMHQWHGRRCFETITASHTSQWRAWHMSVVFMGGQLRKTSSSANHWKPGQQERMFLKYWTALWHKMDFGGQDVLISVLTGRHSGVGNARVSSCSQRHWSTLQHPPRGSCCQGNAWQLEILFGHYSENG
jgi:hypothetical protein